MYMIVLGIIGEQFKPHTFTKLYIPCILYMYTLGLCHIVPENSRMIAEIDKITGLMRWGNGLYIWIPSNVHLFYSAWPVKCFQAVKIEVFLRKKKEWDDSSSVNFNSHFYSLTLSNKEQIFLNIWGVNWQAIKLCTNSFTSFFLLMQWKLLNILFIKCSRLGQVTMASIILHNLSV